MLGRLTLNKGMVVLNNGDFTSASVQPCNHSFCLDCITKWTAQNPTCPLCLKTIDSILRKIISKESEDSKEDLCDVKICPVGLKKTAEEEFECFDHQYFVKEYKALNKKIEDAEFNLKAEIGMRRRKIELEKNYQMALHMKQEVQMKINFLGRVKKISPRDLLEDIEHFCDLLRKINSSKKSYTDDFEYTEDCHYDDDDYYYNQADDVGNDNFSMYSIAVTKGAKTKKKNKGGKAKNKKNILEDSDSTTVLTN